MVAGFVAQLAGGLLAMWVLSRIVRRVAWNDSEGWKRVLAPTTVALVLGTVLAAFGMADGGSPDFARAFAIYVPAALLLMAFDAARMRTRRAS